MKGDITFKILEFLEEAATTTADLIAAVLSSGYGASLSRLNREFEKRHNKRISQTEKLKNILQERERLYKIIHHLKHQGFIQKKQKKDRWIITGRGKEKLTMLQKRSKKRLPSRVYSKTKSSQIKIIIFDIPEREREKRAWLRYALKTLDFTMLQKSVWIGKTKLPTDFLEDLNALQLLSYVEIFEINRTGTLKKIT